jgi:hypothetical protein
MVGVAFVVMPMILNVKFRQCAITFCLQLDHSFSELTSDTKHIAENDC